MKIQIWVMDFLILYILLHTFSLLQGRYKIRETAIVRALPHDEQILSALTLESE
jgi:hypothetical protein